jgi:hypothetical protein
MVFHGKGGYDFNTVYNLPIWLRNYIFNEMKKHYEEEKSQIEQSSPNSNTTNIINPDGSINKGAFKEVSQQYKGKSSYK